MWNFNSVTGSNPGCAPSSGGSFDPVTTRLKAFQKIVEVLADHNYKRIVKQCQDKIKSLKKRYKDVIDKSRKSGAGNESNDEISAKDLLGFEVKLHRYGF